ncbi:MAG: hypothetical protein ACI4CT_03600 [Lachnospiraceae bacterium]
MSNRIMGFVGIEKYDIMLYLSRILYHLGQRVLLLDQSMEHGLRYSIPETGFCEGRIVDYRGIDFGMNLPMEVYISEYDYILADFGFNLEHQDIVLCTEIYIVSDMQLHHIKSLSQLHLMNTQNRYLILKDRIPYKVRDEYVYEELGPLMLNENNSYSVYMNERDYQSRLNCQYDDSVPLKNVSKHIKNLLYDILLLDFDKSKIDIAYYLAERGK